MSRYGLGQTALLQLAADLNSSDASLRFRALQALCADFRIRDLVKLVAAVISAAHERIAAGTYADDASQLEQFRPIAAILPRLRELGVDANSRSGKMAALALARFDAPPPSYVRERLTEWLRVPGLAVGLALPAAIGALLSLALSAPFWITFVATAVFGIALTESVLYWSMKRGRAAADNLIKKWGAASST
jgi:hypothetical protein